MEENQDTTEDLSPRPYQSQVLDLALNQNTIVFLPTGAGKTFIAVMLIKQMAGSVEKSFSEGGKRTFFLVNTVALAEQQKQYITRHTCLTVGYYTGDMKVDFWKEDRWIEELNKNQVLVMTAQILYDILMHKYLRLQDINLIVFDECHHAVHQHCMSKIMDLFESCPINETPRVLGLTATLLNSTVKYNRVLETVNSLEDKFYSKIATIQNMAEVESFSTSPNEVHIPFDEPSNISIMAEIQKHIQELEDFLLNYEFEEDQISAPIIAGAELQSGRKLNRKLCNRLNDVLLHIERLGIYGGSLSALKLIMHMEILRSRAENNDSMLMYTAITTTLIMIRKMMEDEMKGVSERDKIYKYSSPQVLTLLEVLKKYRSDDADGKSIIFVERRLTAKVLFLILRAASENIEDLNFVKPDFVVGLQCNPLNCTMESQLEKKRNKEAIDRFRKGVTNIVAASEVLEEGIDIPQCKLVIKYDAPKTYRSYIQSKGRARHQKSHYIVLYTKSDRLKMGDALKCYQNIETLLKSILTGESQISSNDLLLMGVNEDLVKEVDKDYTTEIGAKVTYKNAIPLINRYCSNLPQDAFTKLVPYWFLISEVKPMCQCLLHLPINSPIKTSFKGDLMLNKKFSKQSAAFEACVALHKAGELNDHLLPVGRLAEDFIDSKTIFEVYAKAAEVEDQPQPGTKRCRRVYKKQISSFVRGPAPSENILLYLHVLKISPSYAEPPEDNTRRHAFYKLLNSDQGFGLLSCNKLPELCDFPVFLNVGKIDVSLRVNTTLLHLTAEEIVLLKKFHHYLFTDILKLQKSFVVSDLREEVCHNYLVVPTIKKDFLKKAEIHWQVVKNNCQTPEFKPPLEVERLGSSKVDWSIYQHAVVVPWYRDLPPDQVYIVTNVCEDMTPLSCFPTSAYSTFEEYFKRKYNLSVNNPSQPLFEVKAITNRFNCLKPRSTLSSGRNRNRQEQSDDFEEHLVPELCIFVDFPSDLWLKAVVLPSILHRISHLLLAEELRLEIAAGLGFPSNTEEKWKPLEVDPLPNEDKSKPGGDIAVKNISNAMGKSYSWGDQGEPIDIDRERIENVTVIDVLHFVDFIHKPLELDNGSFGDVSDCEEYAMPPLEPAPQISILSQNGSDFQLAKILQALTCASANDALNLERLETLGDSYLKFISSLFLFLQYPRLDEGKLTQTKGKIVGNRNLFYCGRNRKLAGKIKFHEFNPSSDWIPPMNCIPPDLLEGLEKLGLCPSILFEIIFSKEEQESGMITSESQTKWRAILEECDRKYAPAQSESLTGVQSVPDKVVADCVEALIGTYLQGYGLAGALKLICWLGILPADLAAPSYLFGDSSCSAYVGLTESDVQAKVEYHLKSFEVEQIESCLNYVFNDKGYLLQALSHASYCQNRVTDCYQRLEFLGDAILDFLITCYIYETCEGLSPGDLTDLRSALVNNITFGSLAVRYGLHKFCKYDSSKLFDKVDTYVKIQERNGHKINADNLLLLDESDTSPDLIGESVDVPKVLGDLFESLAGAIYLDSGKSLTTVWNVYYRLMKNELEAFRQDIPKQPVRMLYELCTPMFKPPYLLDEHGKVMMELELFHKAQKYRYYGVGENKADAKRTAAKIALKALFCNEGEKFSAS